MLRGDAEDRAQLRQEHLGSREREPDPADAEERVGLGWHRQRRQRLVRAGVERAHDERAPVERDGDLAQGCGLLVFVGQLGPVEEQELGAEQPDALGAELDRFCGLVRRAEVREHLDPGPVAGGAGLVRALAGRCAAALGALAAVGSVALRVVRGVDLEGAGLAVDEDGRAVGDLQDRVAETDDRREPERTREDRGVSGGGAVRGCDSGDERRIQGGGVAGGELAGDHDAGRVCCARGLAGERADDSPADVEHVRRPLLEQRLLERAVELGDLLRRVVPGALGGGAGVDRLLRGVEQRLVVEQREVGVEDRGVGLAGAARHRVAVALDRFPGGGDSLVEAVTFEWGVVGDAVRWRAGGAVEVVDGAEREAGRGGDAGENVARLRRSNLSSRLAGWPASPGCGGGSGCGGGARRWRASRHPVAEALVRQLGEGHQHVVRLRTRGAD